MSPAVMFVALAGSTAAEAASVANTSSGLSAPQRTIHFSESGATTGLSDGDLVNDQWRSAFGVSFAPTNAMKWNAQPGADFGSALSGDLLGNFDHLNPIVSPFSIFFETDVTEPAVSLATGDTTTRFTAKLDETVVESFDRLNPRN